MTESMIEKVAKAIYAATPRNKPWSLLSTSMISTYIAEARAAIEAICEPDKDICADLEHVSRMGGVFTPESFIRTYFAVALKKKEQVND